jgi:c-di-GMP-binding flagellar brake protein YcgR
MPEPHRGHFRAFERLPSKLPIKLLRDGPELAGELCDLGLGGAGLVLPEVLGRGESVRLLLDLPRLWDPLEIPAQVVWHMPHEGDTKARVGLRFVAPRGRVLRHIAETLFDSSS